MKNIYSALILCSAIILGGNSPIFAQSSTFTSTGSLATYTVPPGVTSIQITATGGQGGNSTTGPFSGGQGAIITGVFTVSPGDILDIVTGVQPASVTKNAGGGGGSFVWNTSSATTPMIVAGGGGGAGTTANGIDASLTTDGTNGGGGAMYGGAGTAGGGGIAMPSALLIGYGAGGCGWLTNGAAGSSGFGVVSALPAQGGDSPNPSVSPGSGAGGLGETGVGVAGNGGFGGGGGGEFTPPTTPGGVGGGGGGGGYSGGGGGAETPSAVGGGGGGSFCGGTLLSSSVSSGGGNGLVVISIPCGPGAITGNAPLCTGSTEPLTDTPSGGTWISTNTTIATVDGSGNAWGVAPGTDLIYYIVLSSCGTIDTISAPLVVIGSSAGTITGTASVCVGTTTTLSDAASGGSWSVSNTNATITSGGVVTGASPGLDTIFYTNPCSGLFAVDVVTISPAASAGSITGTLSLCTGAPATTLSSTSSGGTWSSSNTAVATITVGPPGGAVTPVSAGTSTITYTVTGACGPVYTTATFTVNTTPSAGTISGSSPICMGTSVTFTETVTGGTWTSTSTAVATVATSGLVTPVAPGSATISYSVANSCGSATATYPITVAPLPVAGTISGPTSVCVGATITLTDVATGGAWSASNTDATVSGGSVTGAATGTDVISYTVTNSCGSVSATQSVVVNPLPSAESISGSSTVCIGSPVTLTDAATGGAWSATNTNATVSGGVVTGATPGADNIYYIVSNSCGADTAVLAMTIGTTPTVGTVTGTDSVCTGHTVTLSDATSGGAWSASNTNATVAAGVVTGSTAGMDTVIYTVTNACGSDSAILTIKVKACTSDVGTIAESADDVMIYPNPANEELTIKMSEGSYSSFTITNSLGQLLITQQLNSSLTGINIKALPSSAVYYVTFRGQSGAKVEKFIKM